jgi:hypothetical protein
MGHSLNRTNFRINNSLIIKDGHEMADHILISDSFGLVKWVLPADYISKKPTNHYIGELFGGGVVVSVWVENGIERCLVASTENISTTSDHYSGTSFNYGLNWSSVQNVVSGAAYKSFGSTNTDLIITQSINSSAKKCFDYLNPDMGTGVWDDWYLPSIYELNQFINNAAIFNKVLDFYAYDNNLPKKDVVNVNAFYSWPNYWETTYATIGIYPSNINLFSFGPTKWTRNSYDEYFYTGTEDVDSNDYDYYWSSSEDSSTHAWAVMSGKTSYNPLLAPSSFNLDSVVLPKSASCKVKPFRIADDTQKSFNFDADYAIITYKFSGERDLDTRTTIISPYLPESESGFGTSYDGVGWTPDYPTHPYSSTYSVIWHAEDNIGSGYETVLINFNAFKYYYPGQSEIIIDARAHWYVQNWVPDFERDPYDQLRLDETLPVILGVDLYKGGLPIKNPTDLNQWINPTAGASMSVESYGKIINVEYTAPAGSGQRVAKLKYNVVGKFGYLFIND